MIDETTRRRVLSIIKAAKLPTDGLKLPTGDVVDAMALDKKVASGKIRFVLPDRIGHVVIRDDIPVEMAARAVDFHRG